MATIAEILRMSLEERKQAYSVSGLSTFDNKPIGIETVIIDGNPFTDYGAFSFLWEKSYVKSPERSGDGTIGNLNSYATFLTPHLKIDFSMMSIDSYRVLMRDLLYKKNEFLVTCYDVVNDTMTTNKMYFSTEEMPKLWTIARALNGEEWVELLGVQDYTVEMIGTNASLETVEILYYDNDGNLIDTATQTVDKGTQAIINYAFVAPTGKKFDGWWNTKIDKTGARYKNGEAVDLIDNLVLYPELTDTNEYTLSFNYGDGNTLVTQTKGDLINIPILNGETISTAITRSNITLADGTTFYFPTNGTGAKSIVYENKTYEGSSVYAFKGWYWTNVANEETRVTGETAYNYTLNRTIYQIYEPIKHAVIYNTNTDGAISIDTDYVGYGEKVYLPTLAKTGYTHNGWYTTRNFQDGTSVGLGSTTMPPYELTLYAKWVKNE